MHVLQKVTLLSLATSNLLSQNEGKYHGSVEHFTCRSTGSFNEEILVRKKCKIVFCRLGLGLGLGGCKIVKLCIVVV